MSWLAGSLARLFDFWHRVCSPALPVACRFQPTCSQYGAEALRTHGLARGLILTLGRLCRCHPWGASGFDPVPRP